jgi:hypothetical protein
VRPPASNLQESFGDMGESGTTTTERTRGAGPSTAVDGARCAVARRAGRRRTLVTLAGISVGWKVLVFTLGAALPHWLLTDGVAELPLSHRAHGAASLATARSLFDTPLERVGGVIQAVRVVSVDTVARPEDAAGPRIAAVALARGTDGCALRAHVRAYTYFAIPYSEVRTRCADGVIEYRVFRPKGRADH